MTQQQPASGPSRSVSAPAVVAEHRTWFTILGILLIVLGVIAIAFPFVTTIAAKIFLGWLFLIGGVFQIIHAFSTQRWSEFFFNLLIGVLYVLAGGWLAFFPLTGILTLTILLAVMFIIQGVLELGIAFRMRPQQGWVWMLVAGIIAILAGLLIIAELPSSAVWAIGLLVGVNMIVTGVAYLLLPVAADRTV
jgi:uncharacterized membrane protein HdeD (DUF308 family)